MLNFGGYMINRKQQFSEAKKTMVLGWEGQRDVLAFFFTFGIAILAEEGEEK